MKSELTNGSCPFLIKDFARRLRGFCDFAFSNPRKSVDFAEKSYGRRMALIIVQTLEILQLGLI
jgi:hypothetical protein